MIDIPADLRSRLVDVRSLCAKLGIERSKSEDKKWICPRHGGGSLSVRLASDRTIQVRCFGCDLAGDVFTLVAEASGLDAKRDFPAVMKIVAEIANATDLVDELARPARAEVASTSTLVDETYAVIWQYAIEALSPMVEYSPHVAAYLRGRKTYADAEASDVRGLPRDAAALITALLSTFVRADLERAGVLREGRDEIDFAAWPVLIPWRDRHGRITCMQRRALDGRSPKYRTPSGRSPRAPFGIDVCAEALAFIGSDAAVTIVEGALDACARRRIARWRGEHELVVLGIYSASTPLVGLPLDLLAGRRVVIGVDADEAGERAATKLVEALRGVARQLDRERPVGAKDWADALATEARA